MFNIRVKRVVNASIDTVFNAIVDHGNYAAFPMIDASSLLEEGEDERNGKGAFRIVKMKQFQV